MRLLITVLVLLLGLFTTAAAQTTKEEQAALTPDAVLADLIRGNERFLSGNLNALEIEKRIANSAKGQYPKAAVLSCVDSRVPVELIFDQGIGDIFVARVAGNIIDEELVGSMEFAARLAGARLMFVLGHSSCGAIKAACDGAQLGHLTTVLARIQPAVDAVKGFKPEERNSANKEFVEKVCEEHVRQTIATIREGSPVLAEMEASGQIRIVGGIYSLDTGKVTLLK